jgi:Zn-dependent alcohol dehydrogenase
MKAIVLIYNENFALACFDKFCLLLHFCSSTTETTYPSLLNSDSHSTSMATSDLPQTFPSILTHEPHIDMSSNPPRPHPVWKYHSSTSFPQNPPNLHPHELLVKIVATGICHTDVFVSCIPSGYMPGVAPYPKILGHEGAGTVLAVGSSVTQAKEGDHVLLSYDYCGTCSQCKLGNGMSCDCVSFNPHNTYSKPAIFKSKSGEGGAEVETSGKFFGQSSFSSYTLVEQKSVVNVTKLINGNMDELKLLAPLGCGLMTGGGAMLNVAKLTPESVVLVLGAGAVGMGAVMAARNIGVKGIIVVDRVAHRLATAKELGATETLDTTGMEMDAVPKAIMEVAAKISGGNPLAIDVSFETTGNIAVTQAGMSAMGIQALMIVVGIPPPGSTYTFSSQDLYMMKKRYVANILGNSDSRVVVPKMIEWWREGKFEIEKLVKYFDAKDAEKALEGMESGRDIKPIIVW